MPADVAVARGRLGLWIPALVLSVIVLGCFVGPLIGPVPAPVNGDIGSALLPVGSPGHLLGTDPVGNDVLARVLYGGRVSIEVGLASNALGLALGGLIGLVAGYRGGLTDVAVTAVLDVLIAFPALVLTLVAAAYLGPGELHLIGALCFFSVPTYARVARAQTLRLREEEFVDAARGLGARPVRVILTHLAPNVLPALLAFGYVGISITIMFEASLSFIGLGVRRPAPSWGNMIAEGQESLTSNPSLVLIPSIFLFLTVVSINLLGDGLRTRATR